MKKILLIQEIEFAGLEDVSIDMTKHRAIKKKVTETTEYEEVEYD